MTDQTKKLDSQIAALETSIAKKRRDCKLQWHGGMIGALAICASLSAASKPSCTILKRGVRRWHRCRRSDQRPSSIAPTSEVTAMSEEPVRYTIDDDDAAPAKRRTDDAEARAAAETEKTRHALADAAAAKNELLQARREHAAIHLQRIDAETAHAQRAYSHAWENGDAAKMADAQREIAALEVRRNNCAAYAAQLDRTQPVPTDPVEAFAAGRAPQIQAWIRAHPEYVIDERKFAKMNAAHSDAVAEGIAPDTDEYFSHVNQFLGLEGGGGGHRRSGGGAGTLRVIQRDALIRIGLLNKADRDSKTAVRQGLYDYLEGYLNFQMAPRSNGGHNG